MLTLSLLRHAKSSWDEMGSSDFERPLAPRGIDAAPRMGRAMHEAGVHPELVLCSAAARTRQTLDLVLPELGLPSPTLVYDEKLYLAPPESLLTTIHTLSTKAASIMIVGHNPGHHLLALALAGTGSRPAMALLADKFPTAGLAVLTFKTTLWRDVTPGTGTLTHFITPRGLATDPN
jgi:phosphohistidine phosphatase